MTPFLGQIPSDVEQSLKQVMDLSWQGVDVRVERIQLEAGVPGSRIAAPFGRSPRGLRRVTGRSRGKRGGSGGLKVVGATIGETIFIDPDYAEWDTAAGQALLAHERKHLEQKRTIPNFDVLYAEEDRITPKDRPWENPYEYAAYLYECQTWHKLIKRGLPEGSWVPLGAQIGLCHG